MADHKRGRGAQDGVEEHSRGDEEGDSSPTNYICGFCGLLASFRHLEKSYENITHLVAPQGTKTGNKTVTNLHIWRWKTIVLHALHVHFSFWAFRERTRSFHYVKWPVLQLCGWNEHMMTNFQFCFLPLKHWFQFNSRIVRTQFSSIMTLNNWKMIAETQSYIFRWCSRCHRCPPCLSPQYGKQQT